MVLLTRKIRLMEVRIKEVRKLNEWEKLEKWEEVFILTAFQERVWKAQDWVKHVLEKPGSHHYVHESLKTEKSAWNKVFRIYGITDSIVDSYIGTLDELIRLTEDTKD